MSIQIDRYAIISSPVGKLLLGSNGEALCFVGFGKISCPVLHDNNAPAKQLASSDDAILNHAAGELEEYFSGKRKEFTVPIKYQGSTFREKVWQELLNIPYGETRSYGDVAEDSGGRQKARAVGGAVHNNPISIIIPCHRVIGADGSLTGFGGGLPIKQALLELEKKYA